MSARTCARHCAGCGFEVVPHTQWTSGKRPPGTRRYAGRGLCNSCHGVATYRGTLLDHARDSLSRDDLLDEWTVLRAEGHTKRQAAARLGVPFARFERAFYRARQAGDPRAQHAPGVRRSAS